MFVRSFRPLASASEHRLPLDGPDIRASRASVLLAEMPGVSIDKVFIQGGKSPPHTLDRQHTLVQKPLPAHLGLVSSSFAPLGVPFHTHTPRRLSFLTLPIFPRPISLSEYLPSYGIVTAPPAHAFPYNVCHRRFRVLVISTTNCSHLGLFDPTWVPPFPFPNLTSLSQIFELHPVAGVLGILFEIWCKMLNWLIYCSKILSNDCNRERSLFDF